MPHDHVDGLALFIIQAGLFKAGQLQVAFQNAADQRPVTAAENGTGINARVERRFGPVLTQICLIGLVQSVWQRTHDAAQS